MQEKKRVGWLDGVKGFTILAVIIGHIADGYLGANLYPGYANILTILYNIAYSFHMLLFFALSGYSFGLAYLEGEKEYKLKTNRIRLQLENIAIIYIMWCIILWAFKMAFSTDVNSGVTVATLLWIPLKAISPYWYLYVLVICYLLTVGFVSKGVHEKYVLIFSAVLCLVQYWIMKSWVGQFTVIQTGAYYFFFSIGLKMSKQKKFEEYISRLPVISINLLIGVLIGFLFIYQQEKRVGWSAIPVLGSIMALALSLAFIGIAQKMNAHIFELIGRYSLEIYLIHCFITAGNRKILPKIGITNFWPSFIVNFLLAVTIPILFSMFMKKIGLHAILFKPAIYLLQRAEKAKN